MIKLQSYCCCYVLSFLFTVSLQTLLATSNENDSEDEKSLKEEMKTMIKDIQKQVEKKKFRKKIKNKVLKLLDELSTKAENCDGMFNNMTRF